MRIKVTDIDNIDKILQALEELEGTQVQVGIVGESGGYDGTDLSVLDVGQIHEFGTPGANIPERSFIRGTFDSKYQEIVSTFEELLVYSIQSGVSPKPMLEAYGAWAAGLTQEYLTDLDSPPLKPSTIKQKGSSNPLIDTGQLRASIDYKITKGGD